MPNFSTSHIKCWDRLQILISELLKYGYPSHIPCSKANDICKIRLMVIKLIQLGYVNNHDKNRYIEKN